jgi:5'-nucleotidase
LNGAWWFGSALVKKMAQSPRVVLREGMANFLKLAYSSNIPTFLLSEGMADIIQHILERFQLHDLGLEVIGNEMAFDESDRFFGLNSKPIYRMSKTGALLKVSPQYTEVTHRKNIIVLGDSPSDVQMAEGLPGGDQTVLKIGFQKQSPDEARRKEFDDTFDVVIDEDGTAEDVALILRHLLTPETDA